MGRSIKYTNEEDRKNALTQSKTKYMLNKTWICEVCNDHDYKLAGKWSHMHTRKHIFNTIKKAVENADNINLLTDNQNT